MAEVTREELAAMTDQELLAYEREHHGDPYMSLLRAKGMQRVALRFWHAGAAGRRRTDRPRWRRGVARNVGRRLLIDAPLYNSAKHGLSSIANASV